MTANTTSQASSPYNPPHDDLRVLHHDDALLVLSKPSGLLSVPGRTADKHDSLEVRAREQFPNALLVHRLDMETSGIFIMAISKEAQKHLGQQFERRSVKKHYIARVSGHLSEDSGRVDLPLRCDWENRPRQMVCYEHGKPSQTDWEVLEREDGDITRVLLKPVTGRSHQLRVHMAALGHPILGDPFYADEKAFHAVDRLELHACDLTLLHPINGETITFRDDAPF